MTRRFHDGQTFRMGPHEYRVVHGKKGPNDLRLDWRWVTEWVPVSLEDVALIVDSIAENEALLYPKGQGAGKVAQFAIDAIKYGHGRARAHLQQERATKADRLEVPALNGCSPDDQGRPFD